MTSSVVNVIECKTAEDFWSRLSPENPLMPPPRRLVFRGQGDADWPLVPSVLRPMANGASLAAAIFGRDESPGDDHVWAEQRLLELFVEACDRTGLSLPGDSSEFRRKWFGDNARGCDQFLKAPETWPSEELYDCLALAQHHGLPTRLLDWSRRAHVAAYFAAVDVLRPRGKHQPARLAVWALDLERKGLIQDIQEIRVPGSTSRNLAAQEGLFTLLREQRGRGETYVPRHLLAYVEECFSHNPQGSPLWKITLPREEARGVLARCNSHGVSAAILFPGYDGAARSALDDLFRFGRPRDA